MESAFSYAEGTLADWETYATAGQVSPADGTQVVR